MHKESKIILRFKWESVIVNGTRVTEENIERFFLKIEIVSPFHIDLIY